MTNKKVTRILKPDAERLLANVPEEYVFRCCDGRNLRNMGELGDALITMADETFAFHSNTEKHDFSNWLRDIVRDEKVAEDLEKPLNKGEAASIVSRRIAFLRSKLA